MLQLSSEPAQLRILQLLEVLSTLALSSAYAYCCTLIVSCTSYDCIGREAGAVTRPQTATP